MTEIEVSNGTTTWREWKSDLNVAASDIEEYKRKGYKVILVKDKKPINHNSGKGSRINY